MRHGTSYRKLSKTIAVYGPTSPVDRSRPLELVRPVRLNASSHRQTTGRLTLASAVELGETGRNFRGQWTDGPRWTGLQPPPSKERERERVSAGWVVWMGSRLCRYFWRITQPILTNRTHIRIRSTLALNTAFSIGFVRGSRVRSFVEALSTLTVQRRDAACPIARDRWRTAPSPRRRPRPRCTPTPTPPIVLDLPRKKTPHPSTPPHRNETREPKIASLLPVPVLLWLQRRLLQL